MRLTWIAVAHLVINALWAKTVKLQQIVTIRCALIAFAKVSAVKDVVQYSLCSFQQVHHVRMVCRITEKWILTVVAVDHVLDVLTQKNAPEILTVLVESAVAPSV